MLVAKKTAARIAVVRVRTLPAPRPDKIEPKPP
jgi:hypothetical protein